MRSCLATDLHEIIMYKIMFSQMFVANINYNFGKILRLFHIQIKSAAESVAKLLKSFSILQDSQ